MGKTNTGIPGVSFSWKRALGISRMRTRIARSMGVPTTRAGAERKIGAWIVQFVMGLILGRKR